MKRMTCRQLGGACDLVFTASSFDEMAEQSRQHGILMFQEGDEAHLAAMEKMRSLKGTPGAMQAWFDGKRAEFDALPDSE